MPNDPRTVTAAEVRRAVRGVMAAYPKGTRFGPASVVIKDGEIHASVTPLGDSVQADSREDRLNEIKRQLAEKVRARP
jgi:hypothetical protein